MIHLWVSEPGGFNSKSGDEEILFHPINSQYQMQGKEMYFENLKCEHVQIENMKLDATGSQTSLPALCKMSYLN